MADSISADAVRPLALGTRLTYSVGHVLNDLCASMWFSYLLVFLHYVVRFNNELAGYAMLLGQVVDAVCTPLIGFESDRSHCCSRYGRRKSWHLIGTLSVAATFCFLFIPCLGCSHSVQWAQLLYYAPFIAIFQFGWASTQISHLALIPQLTTDTHERLGLNAYRYACTVMSNVAVYAIAWFLFSHSSTSLVDSITPDDAPHFKLLAFIVIGIGLVFSIIYHVGTPEPQHQVAKLDNVTERLTRKMTWSDWLKEHQFYQVAALYMCTRLIVNVSQIYLPFYLTDSLHLHQRYIAIIPLVVFVSGFVVALLLKPLSKHVGKKLIYAAGVMFLVGSCVWMNYVQEQPLWEVYGIAVLLGTGTSILLVTSLAMTADLIGTNTESGAFVYGAMSFTDKLSNGAAVVAIQRLHPCKASACCAACVSYYRNTMVYVPGAIAIAAFLLLLSLVPQHIGNLRRLRDSPYEETAAINDDQEDLLES